MTGFLDDQLQFDMLEWTDPDGAVRLQVLGELDLSTTEPLRERLRALSEQGRHVRIDLARLDFIDCTGLGELITAIAGARRDGWELEIDPEITPPVRHVMDLAGARSYLWPDGG